MHNLLCQFHHALDRISYADSKTESYICKHKCRVSLSHPDFLEIRVILRVEMVSQIRQVKCETIF